MTIAVGLFHGDIEIQSSRRAGYHRVVVEDNILVPLGGTVTFDVQFPEATGDWEEVTGFGIFDERGRLLVTGKFGVTRTIQRGDSLNAELTVDFNLYSHSPKTSTEVDKRPTAWERLLEDEP